MKKKPVKKKASSKLLSYLGGKLVSLTLRESKNAKSTLVVRGILLDYDEGFYYLGENVDVQIVVPRFQVTMIADGDLLLDMEPEEEDYEKPFGTKLQ